MIGKIDHSEPLYVRRGRQFVRAYSFPGFMTSGVWLVEGDCTGGKCTWLGDLPEAEAGLAAALTQHIDAAGDALHRFFVDHETWNSRDLAETVIRSLVGSITAAAQQGPDYIPPRRPIRPRKVEILYTNWKGETRHRTIIPYKLFFGSTDYHQDEQWLLLALDCEKDEERAFAMSGIDDWQHVRNGAE